MANKCHIEGKTIDEKVQELREVVYLKIPKYDPARGAFSTYIFTCLNNYIRNQIKHNAVEVKKRIELPEGSITEDRATGITRILEKKMKKKEFHVITDYYLKGFSIKDILYKYYPDKCMNTVQKIIKADIAKAKEVITKYKLYNI